LTTHGTLSGHVVIWVPEPCVIVHVPVASHVPPFAMHVPFAQAST
jgi:hypothetical protein